MDEPDTRELGPAAFGKILRPPLSVLYQACVPAGERRARRIKRLERPPEERRGNSWMPGLHERIGPERSPEFKSAPLKKKDKPTDEVEPGNLPYADYRFWLGAELQVSIFSRCRGCRTPLMDVEARREHHQKERCSLLVVEAIGYLSKHAFQQCVMCEKKTYRQVWGVFLCDTICQELWMFHSAPSPLWIKAIAVVKPAWEKNNEKIRKREKEKEESIRRQIERGV